MRMIVERTLGSLNAFGTRYVPDVNDRTPCVDAAASRSLLLVRPALLRRMLLSCAVFVSLIVKMCVCVLQQDNRRATLAQTNKV
jgi:hypothetical protein